MAAVVEMFCLMYVRVNAIDAETLSAT